MSNGKITKQELSAELNQSLSDVETLSENLSSHNADTLKHFAYATASGTNTYTVSIPGIDSLVEGMSVKVKFTNANTGASTLNINGLGAKAIQKSNGNALSSGNIKAGQIVHLVYTGLVFQLLGEGGEYGTATAADVLAGKTIGTENGLVTGTIPSKAAATITPGKTSQVIAAGQYLSGAQTIASLGGNAVAADVLSGKTFSSDSAGRAIAGTMTNRGAVTSTITTQGGQYTIPAGYHSGSGKVTASFPNLLPENVKEGVAIGGVTGTAPVILASGSFSLTTSNERGSSTSTTLYGDAIPDIGEATIVMSIWSSRYYENIIGGVRRVSTNSFINTTMIATELSGEYRFEILQLEVNYFWSGVRVRVTPRINEVTSTKLDFVWIKVRY